MKTGWKILITSTVVIGAVGYAYFGHTMRGRVLSMYAFGGFKAPASLKIDCAKQTDQKVIEKFNLPLDFDEESKNALREFWHFSYYRACLFESGYDFGGNIIAASKIEKVNNVNTYTNHFAKIKFNLPEEAQILTDNTIDPDFDDYIITSTIRVGDNTLIIKADRSKKDAVDLAEIEKNFTGFSTTTAQIVYKKFSQNQAGSAILAAHQDDALFGFLSLTPNKLMISIYGEKLPKSLLDTIESSFSFLEE